ncbi:response regulator [Dyadobacter sp. CY312]|uniref:response regulator n=1 Tax=Dyadobacter sp. CY312 TaxID=2907303 RepID=UPI001F3CF3BD|nr:response regulator [Dyadobacter sp. CY312]MCE7041439.1 response regulator [Dyadobacter sp. CY312]
MEKSKTIYLADDDADDRFLIKEAAKEIDPNVTFVEAENGSELMEKIESDEIPDPSLIVVDMNMPVMNGLEAVEAIRSNPDLDDVPAVMLSTSNDPELANKALKSGANEVLVKPNTFKGLLEVVKRIINWFRP